MDAKLIQSVIDVISIEKERRIAELPKDDRNAAYDQWYYYDHPFVNELYLMLLVVMWHQIEKELLWLAARPDGGTTEIAWENYRRTIKDMAKMRPDKRWENINKKLCIKKFADYRALRVLQTLANSYKHDPFGGPGEKLLKRLKLQTNGVTYDSLPQSPAIAEALYEMLGIDEEDGYAGITTAFLEIAERFLIEVKSKTKLNPIEKRVASFSDFAR